jgi:hypothetical protein
VVAACFALLPGGNRGVTDASAPEPAGAVSRSNARHRAAARLHWVAAAAGLSLAQERALLSALGEAHLSGNAAAAYFASVNPDEGALDIEQEAEVKMIVDHVITSRLGPHLDEPRLQAVRRALPSIVDSDWPSLAATSAR